jgi:hypothetical protein
VSLRIPPVRLSSSATRLRPAFFLALVGLVTPVPAESQAGPIRYRVHSESGALEIQIGDLLDPELHEALDEGFPIRIQLRATLWRAGFFDSRIGQYDWRASVRRNGSEEQYELEVGAEAERHTMDSFAALLGVLRRELTVPLRPTDPGRYYYGLALEVVSLSVSDLDELERWLQGESDPDDGADERGALSRGVQRLFVRALGLPSRSLQRRSSPFDWPG